MRWPEDPDGGLSSCFYQLYDRWTYAYMGPILAKGKSQVLQDGTRLSQDDLFQVPDSMRSKALSQKFR